MIKWFKEQNATTKGMIIVILLLVAGSIIRWDYVSNEVAGAFKGLFEKPKTENTVTQ